MARNPSHAERMAMAGLSLDSVEEVLTRGDVPKRVVSFGRRTPDEPLVTSDADP
jgi:hypothetical protein